MSGWAAAAQAAVKIADQFITSRSGSSAAAQSRKAREHDYNMFLNQKAAAEQFERESMTRQVQGARAAGIHPLFAVGKSGNFSPTSFAGGGGGHGVRSDLAGGVSDAFTTLRQGRMDAQTKQMNDIAIERQKVALAKDQLELQAANAALAGAKRQAMWGDGLGAPGTGNDATAKTYPYGTKRGPELRLRPLTAEGRRSIPETIELVGPDGEYYTIVNPEIGDESAQGSYWYEKAKRGVVKSLEARARAEKGKRARDRKAYRRSDHDFWGGS